MRVDVDIIVDFGHLMSNARAPTKRLKRGILRIDEAFVQPYKANLELLRGVSCQFPHIMSRGLLMSKAEEVGI
jgi:hypothetical protein